MKILSIVATSLLVPILSLLSARPDDPAQDRLGSTVSELVVRPALVSMGPDPGGHTGATVTPETTKTGQPAVDNAREVASGGKTEHSGPPLDDAQQSKKKEDDKR